MRDAAVAHRDLRRLHPDHDPIAQRQVASNLLASIALHTFRATSALLQKIARPRIPRPRIQRTRDRNSGSRAALREIGGVEQRRLSDKAKTCIGSMGVTGPSHTPGKSLPCTSTSPFIREPSLKPTAMQPWSPSGLQAVPHLQWGSHLARCGTGAFRPARGSSRSGQARA
jgi:hypothetical protein